MTDCAETRSILRTVNSSGTSIPSEKNGSPGWMSVRVNVTQLTPVVKFRFINHVTALSSSKAARKGLDGGELGDSGARHTGGADLVAKGGSAGC